MAETAARAMAFFSFGMTPDVWKSSLRIRKKRTENHKTRTTAACRPHREKPHALIFDFASPVFRSDGRTLLVRCNSDKLLLTPDSDTELRQKIPATVYFHYRKFEDDPARNPPLST